MKDTPCRLAGYVVCDRLSGRFWPADCDTGTCPQCGVNRARVRARLVTERCRTELHPRFITFTLAPLDWQERRAKVRDLARRLRGSGYRTEWIWTTEPNPAGTGLHIHAIQHGDYIPQARLQDMWGGFRVDIRSAKPRHGEYISKSASRVAHYIGKRSNDALDSALALNGGRLHHWSRGFFGMPIREYRKSVAGTTPTDCVLVFAPDLRADLR